ncbi:MAG: TonB-dependent receptor, partial [Pseudomonadota bacterium]
MKTQVSHLFRTSGLATVVFVGTLTIGAMPALAQDADTQASGDRTLDTVTVTTTRREESLQDVPIAITAITEDTIEQLAPRNISDLTGLAPNTFIGQTTAVPGGGAIFIRGLGYADVEKAQNPAAGVIIDGVFLGTNTGQLIDAFDIQQVDVNRGPQGIFFGKNTTAGVINVTRSAPTRETGFKGSLGFGSNDEVIVKGIANFGLGENGGIKIGGTYRESEGYLDNLFTGESNGGIEYTGLTASLDYDLTENLNARFTIDRFDQDGGGTPIQYGNAFTAETLGVTGIPGYNPATGSLAGLEPRQVLNDFQDADELTTTIANATFTWDTQLGEITSVTAYVDSEDIVFQDFDGTCSTDPTNCPFAGTNLLLTNPANPAGVLHTIRDQEYEQFTQEVRLAGTQGAFDYLVGIYYYQHEFSLDQTTNGAVFQLGTEDNDSFSVFGNLDWRITDRIKLSAGARFIDETKDGTNAFTVVAKPGQAGAIPIVVPFSNSASFDDVITRFAADWQVTDNNLIYGSISEGFRSGGISIRATLSEQVEGQPNCLPDDGDAIPNEVLCPDNNFSTYEPETVTAFELGSKNVFADGQFTFNAAYFMTQVDDFQINDVVVTGTYGPGTTTYTNNLPEVEIDGFEFEAVWAPQALEGFTLTALLGIQDAEIVDGQVDGRRVGIGPGATPGAPGSVSDRTGG